MILLCCLLTLIGSRIDDFWTHFAWCSIVLMCINPLFGVVLACIIDFLGCEVLSSQSSWVDDIALDVSHDAFRRSEQVFRD